MRRPFDGNAENSKSKNIKRGGGSPYGWAFLDGKLVLDPKEQLIIRQIMKLHQRGKSNLAIAKQLNAKNIPTRLHGTWRDCTIKSIITRYKKLVKKNGG